MRTREGLLLNETYLVTEMSTKLRKTILNQYLHYKILLGQKYITNQSGIFSIIYNLIKYLHNILGTKIRCARYHEF